MKDLLLRAGFVVKTSNMKIYVVIWQATSKLHQKRAARVARLFFFIPLIKSLIGGFVVAYAVIIFQTPQ